MLLSDKTLLDMHIADYEHRLTAARDAVRGIPRNLQRDIGRMSDGRISREVSEYANELAATLARPRA